MWLIYAILTALTWGVAELFYKKGSERTTKYTSLRTHVFVGLIMGIHAIFIMATQGIEFKVVVINMFYYFPVFFLYMLSMVLSLYGLRYIADSLSSPIEESSTAITVLLCFIFLGQTMSRNSAIGVALIIIGVILLGVFESKGESKRDKDVTKKMALVGFCMALSYALLDGIGTFLDAFYLDIEMTPLKFVTEENIELIANCAYEISFMITGIIFLIFLLIKKEKISLKQEKNRIAAAVCEMLGQSFYVFAMSGNAIIAAPIISSVSVITIILCRIFLKEKLTWKQYGAIVGVIIGVFILAIEEVLQEA